MKIFKKLLKARVIVWLATTIVLVVVMIVANNITNQYALILNNVLGGKRPIVSDEESGIPFEQDFATKDEAFENGNAVTKEICEEGMVLLKNEGNALPLKANAKVSVFGKNSVNLVYGGSGSAAPGDGDRATIFDSLEAVGYEYNPTLKSFYENNSASGTGRSKNPKMDSGVVPTLKTGETPVSSYGANITSSYDEYGDAAIVVFSRIAGEDWDLPRKADDNPDRHYLELDNNERALLKHIIDSNKFEHIIVLMNGSNYIDLGFLKEETNATDYNDFGKKVDAAIVIGSPGANGIMALGEILSGAINPSGHTVDTVYTNYQNDPTWQNFGDNIKSNGNHYLNQDGSDANQFYVEYEENIYLGYRYYETRGHIDGEDWYKSNVVYPFGFGLSYTTFEQEITNMSALGAALKADQKFDVNIKVKNTGAKAGKQVVQLYAEAPYENGKIEKAYKVLVGFAKTKLLEPGKEDTVTITVDPYDFASFDTHDKNGNGFKGYELEAGDYIFHAGTDAHTDFATFTKTLADGYAFVNDPVTGTKVEPLFDEVTDHMTESLSRANFAGTFPHMPTDGERKVTSDFLAKFNDKSSTNDEVYAELPTMGADNGVAFKDLVGLDYDDSLWDDFLDQMTFDQMLSLFNNGCYMTIDIEELDIPQTISADGPTGLVNFMSATAEASVYGCCYYCSECLVAQTYNIELAAKQANAIGNECLVGDESTGISYPGWYAPGVNLHRSPFSGRNTEYYSEDPLLNGKFAATVIKGVQEKGVYANVKHFALNDQETNRGGVATWCDEQAIRELYLKPFEFAVKEGGSRGLMTSFNRLGTEWTGGSYRLVTKVLRKEWGFVGSVICDFDTFDKKFMDSKQMLYAGGDINLAGDKKCMLQKSNVDGTPSVTSTDAKDANLLRRSAHNNLFAIVNSNAMKVDVLGYKPPVWRVLLYTGFGVISGALVVWGFFAIFTALRKKDKNAPASETPEENTVASSEETPAAPAE